MKSGNPPPLKRTGRRVMDTGYIGVWSPGHPTAHKDNYALEHRKVAWDAGILTNLANHVHHKNGDKQDNRPENLEALGESEHHTHHISEAGRVVNQHGQWPVHRARTYAERAAVRQQRSAPRACEGCGGEYLPKQDRQRFCTALCARRYCMAIAQAVRLAKSERS